MAIPQELTDALAKVDEDTNKLAVVVKDLRDQVSVGMTDADVAAVKAKLGEVATRLEGIAADPGAPVPPAPAPTTLAKKK